MIGPNLTLHGLPRLAGSCSGPPAARYTELHEGLPGGSRYVTDTAVERPHRILRMLKFRSDTIESGPTGLILRMKRPPCGEHCSDLHELHVGRS